MSTFSFLKNREKIFLEYPFDPPEWFPQFFFEIACAYHIGAKNPSVIDLSKFREPIANLMKRYLESKKMDIRMVGIPSPIIPVKELIQGENICIMLSGGKDSVHLLVKALEKYPKDKLYCFYVPNLNKSEQYYEKKSVIKICNKLGVKIITPEVKNSVQINRMNHNISFREQLIFTICLPYILNYQCGKIYWGNYVSFFDPFAHLYVASKESVDFISQCLEEFGIKITHHNHTDLVENFNADSIFSEMVIQYRELLDLTSSCYTQINFRENRHKLLKGKIKSINIYNGCGSCIKCLRINAAILAFGEYDKKSQDYIYLANHIMKFYKEKYHHDETLSQLVPML